MQKSLASSGRHLTQLSFKTQRTLQVSTYSTAALIILYLSPGVGFAIDFSQSLLLEYNHLGILYGL